MVLRGPKRRLLVFVDENPNYGPYLLTANKNRAASCSVEPVWRVGTRYILTPVYAGGWKMRFATMDGIKLLTRIEYGVKAQSTSRYLTSGHQRRSATGLYAGETIISMLDNFRIKSTFTVCAFGSWHWAVEWADQETHLNEADFIVKISGDYVYAYSKSNPN